MIGKTIKISDYKFTYGQETVFINVFGVFKDLKSGNRYIIYSYDNKKLYYGSFFIRDNAGTVMISKDTNTDIIKGFIDDILSQKKNDKYEIVNLDKIESIQIIDEQVYESSVDINRLDELTIPKNITSEEEVQPKKKVPFFMFGIMLLLVVLGLFFFINPEVIKGKNIIYTCNKTSNHKELPASMKEERIVTFNSKGKVISMDINTDYVFSDIEYYNDFKNKGIFYKYMKTTDTYKFDDVNYTYRVFSSIDVENNYFLPSEEEELITYFNNDGYNCKIKEE